MGQVVASIQTRGSGRRFMIVAEELDRDAQDAIEGLGTDAELIFASHAPTRTGRLGRGIQSVLVGAMVIVRSTARNPKTGYNYTGVTRFGHRTMWIEPRHSPRNREKYLAPIPGVGPRWVYRQPALSVGGRFFARVRGYKPSHDWAEEAIPEVHRETTATATRLGREIVAKLS